MGLDDDDFVEQGEDLLLALLALLTIYGNTPSYLRLQFVCYHLEGCPVDW